MEGRLDDIAGGTAVKDYVEGSGVGCTGVGGYAEGCLNDEATLSSKTEGISSLLLFLAGIGGLLLGGSEEGATGTELGGSLFPAIDLIRPRVRFPRNRATSAAIPLSELLIFT